MGANMVGRLLQGGHSCVVHDVQPAAIDRLTSKGATGAASQQQLVGALARPPAIWLMVPEALVDQVLAALAPLLDADDVVIDGGNSNYRDDIRRATTLQARAIQTLYARFASRGEADFANCVLSAMRHEFGGHVEKDAPKAGR